MNRQVRSVRLRTGFTLIELLVVMAIIGLLVAMLMPAVQAARESARRTSCLNNIKQIALACNTYVGTYGSFPSGYITVYDSMGMIPATDTANFSPAMRIPVSNAQATASITTMSVSQWWGWQAMLLPYVGEQTMNLSFINDSMGIKAANDKLKMKNTVKPYLCPTSSYVPNSLGYAYTSYRGSIGSYQSDANGNFDYQGGIFGPNSAISNRDIIDGESQTVMIGETLFGFWGDGYSCCASERSDRNPLFDFAGGSNPTEWGFGSWHKDVCLVGMADGSGHALKKSLNRGVFQRLVQRNDQQPPGEWQ